MSDFTRWWLILAAQIEAAAAWRRVRHYCWLYQSVAPLDYLRNPRNQFGWLPLSWLFLRESKLSLLSRIQNELVYMLYQEELRTPNGRMLPLYIRATHNGRGWYVSS